MFHNTPFTFFIITGISHFSKVCVMPLWFYKRLTLITVFANPWKKSRRICAFMKKKVKSESDVQPLLCLKPLWSQHTLRAASRAVPAPSPGTTRSMSASTLQSSNYVCKHLCFVSVYFMHLLARLGPKLSEKPK